MEIVGKVVQLGTLIEGNSPRGPWKKQELIIETVEQYPKKVCLLCWNERVNDANSFFVGQTIKAQISGRQPPPPPPPSPTAACSTAYESDAATNASTAAATDERRLFRVG